LFVFHFLHGHLERTGEAVFLRVRTWWLSVLRTTEQVKYRDYKEIAAENRRNFVSCEDVEPTALSGCRHLVAGQNKDGLRRTPRLALSWKAF
jgi:hypothetical protein